MNTIFDTIGEARFNKIFEFLASSSKVSPVWNSIKPYVNQICLFEHMITQVGDEIPTIIDFLVCDDSNLPLHAMQTLITFNRDQQIICFDAREIISSSWENAPSISTWYGDDENYEIEIIDDLASNRICIFLCRKNLN